MRTAVEMSPDFLGRRIRFVRETIGLPLADFAAELNISRAHASRIETGASWPSVYLLREVVKCLGVSADFLLALRRDKEGNYERPQARPSLP